MKSVVLFYFQIRISLFKIDHQFIEDLSIDENNQDEKYLLFYTSLKNIVQNYETLAVLINYC